MGDVVRMPRAPRPNQQVVNTLEAALAAAKAGLVSTALVLTVNPLGEVETATVGDLSNPGRIFLIRMIYQEARKLFLERPIQRND